MYFYCKESQAKPLSHEGNESTAFQAPINLHPRLTRLHRSRSYAQTTPTCTRAPRLSPIQPTPISSHRIKSVRITHCRTVSESLAQYVHKSVHSKTHTLAEMASMLSVCESTKLSAGDIGWYHMDDNENGSKDEHGDLHQELISHANGVPIGTLTTAKTSYGWEVFEVTDVRHVVSPSYIGASRGLGRPITPNMRRTSVKKPVIDPKSYFIQTFGCQMNVSDTERMSAELEVHGYHKTLDPDKSALYIMNTCALRDHAEQKVYSYLGPHAQRKWDAGGMDVTLVVAGCVGQQEGEKLLSRVPEVDIVMGPQYANRIGEVLQEYERHMSQVVMVDNVHVSEDISVPNRGSSVTAWVNIVYGCREQCTYCVVPNTRGSIEQSRSLDAIRKEMEGLGKQGYKEVVLLGQNVDAYGRDLYPKRTFAELLRYVHDVEGIERIRFTTGHPRYISTRLISTVAELPKVMEHFHVPPQSGDNEVLRQMRRGYTRERYIDIAKRIRELMPDASICADTIVGFPGESEDAFENTVNMAKEVVFDANMVRSYSARPNTTAGLREDQVDEVTKKRRLAVLNRLMREQATMRSERYLGREVEVLVEGVNEKNASEVMGRERSNRVVFFEGSVQEYVGKIVKVRVEAAFAFSLRGRVVKEHK